MSYHCAACSLWLLQSYERNVFKKNIPSEWLEENDFNILIHLCKWSAEYSRKRGRKCPSNLKSNLCVEWKRTWSPVCPSKYTSIFFFRWKFSTVSYSQASFQPCDLFCPLLPAFNDCCSNLISEENTYLQLTCP